MSKIEDSVIEKIQVRAAIGKRKYGVTMERNDLSELDWLKHAQEEGMDKVIYLEKLIQEKEKQVRFNNATYKVTYLDDMGITKVKRFIANSFLEAEVFFYRRMREDDIIKPFIMKIELEEK
jgi:hypothetical protein